MRNSPELILGLPIVPPYREGELIQSHLRRIADANCISATQLGRILVGHASPVDKDESLKLAGLLTDRLGYPADMLKSWTLMGFLKLDKRRASKRQFCPDCLAHDLIQSVHLDEPAYAICPTHGLAHYVRCPACRKELSWQLGRHHLCVCGYDLRNSERIKVFTETLELFKACLENRPLGDSQAILTLESPEATTKRLRSALEYL